jgi:hypothetical protein
MDRLIDLWDGFADRFRAVISVVSMAGLALSTAGYAGFVTLPKLLPFTGIWPIVISVVFNAVWWGVLYPRVVERRKAREQLQQANKGSLSNG